MSEIEVIKTCPLGHTCRKVVGDKIEECRWYVRLAGQDPQTGEQIDKSDCAIAWQPLLAVELNRTTFGTGAAIESLRNETVKRQDAALGLVNDVKAITRK